MPKSHPFPVMIAAAGLAVAVAGAPAAAFAESGAPQQAQSTSFSDGDLQAFAAANVEIQAIRARYVEAAKDVKSPEDRTAMQEEMTGEMVTAVNETPGITVEEYNAIARASRSDPDVAARVTEHIKQADR